ncbi:MAG: hypothetical protein IKY70_07345 [Bacteroidales bacterium]|nr:hypothetical protein [Bacteroidales bacterium]
MMNGFVGIGMAECSAVYGGRSESVARIVEIVAQCVGTLAKLIYLTTKRGPQAITDQMAGGYYPKF